MVQFFTGKKILGVELQAEPWFATDVYRTPLTEQKTLMNKKLLINNADYAKAIGFEQNYFWGTEWWYWLGKKQGDWTLWQTARELLSQKNN